MSNFKCDKCGVEQVDSPKGYVSGCHHYPPEKDKGLVFIKFGYQEFKPYMIENGKIYQPYSEWKLKC